MFGKADFSSISPNTNSTQHISFLFDDATPQYGGLICKGGGFILPLTYSVITVDYNNVFFTKFLETGRLLSFKRTLWTGQIYLLMV